MRRRTFLGALAAPLAVPSLLAQTQLQITAAPVTRAPRRGRLEQGVTAGVFRGANLSFEDQCRQAAKLGTGGFDLRGPNFTGFVTHEYSPTQGNDALKEVAKAMEICTV